MSEPITIVVQLDGKQIGKAVLPITTSNPTPYWIRACTSTVPVTISPPVPPDAMRPAYDIRGGVRGKHLWRYRLSRLRGYLSSLFCG